MRRQELMEKISNLAKATAEEASFDMVKLRYFKDHGRRILRITINKEGGITLDDCEKFSKAYSTLLDREDLIEEHYYLEVESPGIQL